MELIIFCIVMIWAGTRGIDLMMGIPKGRRRTEYIGDWDKKDKNRCYK